MAKVISSRQYADWRQLRLESFSSPTVRKAFEKLASQITAAYARIRNRKSEAEIMKENKDSIGPSLDNKVARTGTNLTKMYRVSTSSIVKLSVTIGYGQSSITTVYLENDKLVNEKKNSFEIVLPYTGMELKGKTLFCSTMVMDMSPESNKIGVTYVISGGKEDYHQMLWESVDKDRGVIHFIANFLFI
ncbi:MAG: hypothetical protein AB1746_16495 [Candidatus Zixiibacteriota bacterium]